jgi:catechol 2,3-dioxygenase-like lactoylglutathione lyase family enzyme
MFKNVTVVPTLPAAVLERAQRFYEESLGFRLVRKEADLLVFCAGDYAIHIYRSDAPPGGSTVACFLVDDFDRELAEMRERGIDFEAYELPVLDSHEGTLQSEGARSAWFKDSEGNVLKMQERGGSEAHQP